MVIVAQLAEHLTVDHEVAGSSPVDHPLSFPEKDIHCIREMQACQQKITQKMWC